MDLKLVILDFDGTLADTSDAIVCTFKAAAKACGVTECAPDSEIERSIGLHLRDMYALLCGLTDRDLIERCIATYQVIFSEFYSRIKLFPHVLETLVALKRLGLHLAIATNRGANSLVPLMEQLGLDGVIEQYVTFEDVSHVKPAPDMALELMSRFGVKPEETLIVGDTVYDIEMGKSAGCRTCGVTYGSHSAEMMSAKSPDMLIDDFAVLAHAGSMS